MENRKKIGGKNHKTKSYFFENNNKISAHLERLKKR